MKYIYLYLLYASIHYNMSFKTFNTIEENIKNGIIEYIRFIIEENTHIINFHMLKVRLKENDDEGEWLIYETLFRGQDYDFEIFCEENGFFCKDDFEVLNEYIKDTNGEDYDVTRNDFYWILRICTNTYYYDKMGYGLFIDIWNDFNNVVRNNILK